MPTHLFHPAVAAWFAQTFGAATPAQQAAWPAIHAGRDILIAAPTGSGKTLAAFLAALDSLVRAGLNGTLTDATYIVYVSPLKALSNDIERNLQSPLAGIQTELERLNLPRVDIRVQVRTGDTPASERAAMRKRPPHILVTTPESLYLLLGSDSGRTLLASTRTLIVDEIHALAGNKRGSHLALSLARLDALTPHPPVRVGLSATQKPLDIIARLLVGDPARAVAIADLGHSRARDLALMLPDSPLEAVMSTEVWTEVYTKLAQLIAAHRTTLVFVNTRRLAERVTRHLSEIVGKENVASHHGSLAKEHRLDAEQRLKRGELRALVATASLELGIDIGDVDLVCQLGSPRAINTFLQRVGRANHAVAGVPKARLFPLSRDELIECTALLDAVAHGALDALRIPAQPLDVLAQQLVAEVACREWQEDALFDLVRTAYPYRDLTRAQFDDVVRMLSEGFSTRRGRRSSYLHHDAVNRQLRARRGARLTALTCGGAIPDNADYVVVLEPTGTTIGTLNEDFAVESLAGDVFQLGNQSYRILRVESGRVRVEDALGQPPNIPFWLGEAGGRSDALSSAVAQLRARLETQLEEVTAASLARAVAWFAEQFRVEERTARQIVEYLAGAKAVLTALPTQTTVILERFFDESGGMQLIVHAPFGARINRAWGLSLRKRFCRQFNFELQAAATEDAIILSLGETHSFPLEEVTRYLHSNSARDVLIQATLDAPLFGTRWRWNASIALAIKRFRGGKKSPAPFLRMDAEDLIALIFPDQLACAENLAGERTIPDHPLVTQTIDDCLNDAMDVEGFLALLRAIENGDVRVIARDLPQPSPLAQEVLNAKPYAFLDDAPLEERRTQAVMSRRWLDPLQAGEFAQLDRQAIERARSEAWPEVSNADEAHDALSILGAVTTGEIETHQWTPYVAQLIAGGRAGHMTIETNISIYLATETLPQLRAIYPDTEVTPALTVPAAYARTWTRTDAVRELTRARLQGLGPVTVATLAQPLVLTAAEVEAALIALESEGFALRGRFTPDADTEEWCERRLLARIHRYTVQRLRAEIEPVSTQDFLRFLFEWHGIGTAAPAQGPEALARVVEQLEGFAAPAASWEADVLPARLQDYSPHELDGLCLAGRVVWLRLSPPKSVSAERTATPVRTTPISLLTRKHLPLWRRLVEARGEHTPILSAPAQQVALALTQHGASFFDDIVAHTKLLRSQAEEALAELVAHGRVHADAYSGLRALLIPATRRRALAQRRRRVASFGIEEAGRWTLIAPPRDQIAAMPADAQSASTDDIEQIAWALLRRYGVVFKRVLEREAHYLPPWYELLRVYRRLEARGEIRGGRFVSGFSGEQYALPDAVGALRAMRKRETSNKLISLSGADPLNLVGILTPGPRVPALSGNRVLYRDGIPIAVQIGGETRFLLTVDTHDEWATRNALRRQPLALATRAYLH